MATETLTARPHRSRSSPLICAIVQELSGQDAQPELEQAVSLHEREGNLVVAERTRSRLALTLGAQPPQSSS